MLLTKPGLTGVIACAFLAGCSGLSQSSSPSQALPEGSTRIPVPPFARTPKSAVCKPQGVYKCLFVANESGNTVTIYAPFWNGAPSAVSNGVSQPTALALNTAGDLFVANASANTVTEYAPPYTGTPTTISSGVGVPVALTMNATGDLFVANCGVSCNGASAGPFTVTEYAPPYTGAPTVTISNGVNRPAVLALNTAGDLFVANVGPGGLVLTL